MWENKVLKIMKEESGMNGYSPSSKDDIKNINRRRFLGISAAALAGLGIPAKGGLIAGPQVPPKPAAHPKIKEYRVLGRTGFKVSDIGLGGGEATDPMLLEAVLDSGINYIDAAENYVNGQVESTIGKVLKNRDRKSIFISTKLGLGKDVSKAGLLSRARKCLERLQSDYVDCLMIHCPPTAAALKTEGFHEAVRELKAEGRVKFCGLSQHGAQWNDVSETMEQVVSAAAEDGRFDVVLIAYNFIQTEMGARLLKTCNEKNIGTTIMKANPVGTYAFIERLVEAGKKEGQKVEPYVTALLERVKKVADQTEGFKNKLNLTNTSEMKSAAYRFVLSNPHVNTVCCTIGNYDSLEAYVSLSGNKLSTPEEEKLGLYAQTYGQLYCRHACGQCQSRCPHGVPVNTIMRYQHYFRAQGREKYAMEKYASLPTNRADKCLSCAGHCQAACPYGVPIHGLLAVAHKTLTLA
jgi:predicted aldo/keto reductase-like oxidoreductase